EPEPHAAQVTHSCRAIPLGCERKPFQMRKLTQGRSPCSRAFRPQNWGFDWPPPDALHCNYEFVLRRAAGWLSLPRVYHACGKAPRDDLCRGVAGAGTGGHPAPPLRNNLAESLVRLGAPGTYPWPAHLAAGDLSVSPPRYLAFADQHADVVDVWTRTG